MNKKRCLILLTLIMILFVIYKMVNIYAVFQSESSGNMQKKISDWTILVNNTLISSSQVENFIIDNLNVDPNEHVKGGKIAPGISGKFNITIDPENTDVSVRYDLKINKENLTNENLQIVSILETEENNTLIETSKDVYTAIIPLSKIKNGIKNNIQVKIEWKDDGTTDDKDVAIGTLINPEISIPITVTVSQYMGEEVVAYE